MQLVGRVASPYPFSIRFLVSLVFGVALLCAREATAQESPTSDLERRLEEMDKENQELKERLERLEESGEAAEEEEESAGPGLGLVARSGDVFATFQLFGDVGFDYRDPERSGRGSTAFFIGEMTFFFTARVGDHFSVLSETVLKTTRGTTRDGVNWDQERLWGAWTFSDKLYVKLGLEHNNISRWNRLYHHGRWLEISVTRPFLAQFESTGFLPMHNSGLELGGRRELGPGTWDYTFILANGRGPTATDPQKVSDANSDKSFDFDLGFAPHALDNVHVGAHIRIDDIPPNPGDPARVDEIRQWIFSAHVEYRGDLWDILAEFAYMEDRDRTSGGVFHNVAWYVQVARRFGDRWTPYVRFDYRDMDEGDPYFEPLNRDLDRWEAVLGVRYDLTGNAALKLELACGEGDFRDSVGNIFEDDVYRVAVQLSWVF